MLPWTVTLLIASVVLFAVALLNLEGTHPDKLRGLAILLLIAAAIRGGVKKLSSKKDPK